MTLPRLPQGETQAPLNRTVDLFLPAAGGSEALLAEEVQRLTGRPAQAGGEDDDLLAAAGQFVLHVPICATVAISTSAPGFTRPHWMQ